ncbi:MAG: D-glycero-beta-D-manno-heptose 1-phosphate adenylyltransferase, partial [Terriglobales bacterium]
MDRLRRLGQRIVTTNGCFDILHVGHIRFLKAAKEQGDVLALGLNSDASVRRLKGESRPINNENDRAEVLAALACVDFISIFDEDTPVEFIKAARPNVHVKGADYKPSDLAETPVVEALGGTVHIVALVPGRSTTSLVQKISGQAPDPAV